MNKKTACFFYCITNGKRKFKRDSFFFTSRQAKDTDVITEKKGFTKSVREIGNEFSIN